MDKIRCYDPRTEDYRLTNNPALVFGQIMRGLPGMCGQTAGQKKIESKIAWLADYFDELVDAQPKDRLSLHIQPPVSIHFLADGRVRIGNGTEIDYKQWLTPIVDNGVRVDRKELADVTTDLDLIRMYAMPCSECNITTPTELASDVKVGDHFIKVCSVCGHRSTEIYEG